MKKVNHIKRKTILSPLRLMAFIVFISFAYQSVAQQIFSNPEIKATAKLDTNSIMVGQQTNLHLQISVPQDVFIQWPILNDTLQANIEVIKASEIDTVATNKDDMMVLSQDITISSFDSGYFAIPPFYFIYGKMNDSIVKLVESNALLLEVKNIKVDLNAEIKDIKPIIDEPWTFGEVLPYILALLFALLLIGLGIYIYKRRKQNKPIFSLPQKPKTPAHIVALEKLNKLKEKKLWQSGHSKEFYSELTDILREYMENQLHFGAMEMISDDIITELQKQNLEPTLLDETREVLQTADLVKFAKVKPLADENDRALKWGFSFVEITKPKEKVQETNTESKSKVEPSKTIDQ